MKAPLRAAALLLVLFGGCKVKVLGSTDEPSTVETSVPTGQTAPSYGLAPPIAKLRTPGIPVLVFHEICASACTSADTYGVSKSEFDAILTVLDTRGYSTISMADFARAHHADFAGLPEKPILVTFDDGRQDAYIGADPILAKHGMQATMFVITSDPVVTPTFYMSWAEIQDAAASGRWTMQVHAHAGHVEIPIARGASGSFYANVGCADAACEGHETHAAWHTRAVSDLETADAVLASKLGDLYTRKSFAVPFSDFGQNHTNDPLIPEELRAYFDAQFEVWFTQAEDAAFMTPSEGSHEVQRFLLTNELDATHVDAWLAKHEAE